MIDKAKVMGVLRQVEWCGYGAVKMGLCPCCKAYKSQGHTVSCKLAALLDEASETEKTKLRLAALVAIADTAHALKLQANMHRIVHSSADYIPAYLLGPLRGALDDLNALNNEEE